MQTGERPLRSSGAPSGPPLQSTPVVYSAKGLHPVEVSDPLSVEQWKELLCTPAQALIQSPSGHGFLVDDVKEGTEESSGPIVALCDAGGKETDSVPASELLQANAQVNNACFVVRGFVGGLFTSSRSDKTVKIVSLESDGRGAVSHVTAAMTMAGSSSISSERIRRTLKIFLQEFVLKSRRDP